MSKENPIRVFVYGTLKPGGYYWPRFCEGKVVESVQAKAHGRLYHLPLGYPGMVLDDNEWAQGYILTLTDTAALEGIDHLEGYVEGRDPADNDYDRPLIEVFSPEGDSLGKAWAYVMTMERIFEHRGKYVEDGDWQDNRSTLNPFSALTRP